MADANKRKGHILTNILEILNIFGGDSIIMLPLCV